MPPTNRKTMWGTRAHGRRFGLLLMTLSACVLVLTPGAVRADGPLSVTVTPGQATPNPVAVGQQMTASLSATPNNAPQTTSEVTVTGPTWQWSPTITVQESSDGTNFYPAPASDYSASISAGDPTVSDATFSFTPNVAAYFTAQVSVTVTYKESTTDSPPQSLPDVTAPGGGYVLGIGPATSGDNPPSGSGGGPSPDAVRPSGAHAMAVPAPAPTTPTPGNGPLLVGTILHIFRGGTDVTNTTVTVWAGEGVTLTAQVAPSDLDNFFLFPNNIDSGTEFTWGTAGGLAIGGYSADINNGGLVPLGNPLLPVGQNPLSGNTFHLYWVGESPSVFAPSAKVSLTDATFPSALASVSFIIKAPTVSVTAKMKATVVDDNYVTVFSGLIPGYSLHCGSYSDPHTNDGIIWTFAPPDTTVGQYSWVQLITETGSRTDFAGNVEQEIWNPNTVTNGSFPALDTMLPYTFVPTLHPTNDGSGSTNAADSPGVELDVLNKESQIGYETYKISDQFTDYMFFKPTVASGDACEVPIGVLKWSYGGTATNNVGALTWSGSNYTPATTGTTPPYSPWTTSQAMPTWADNITNFNYLELFR